MKIVIKNNIGQIITDNPDLLLALYNLFSFSIPGAQYSNARRRGGWDGKKHFISNYGRFRAGLLNSILAELKKIGCVPEIDTQHKYPPFSGTLVSPKNLKYYDFQEDLILKALDAGYGIIKSPTGSGKTLIMGGILLNATFNKGTILFNSKQLLTQTYTFLSESCGVKNIGVCFGYGFIEENLMLTTIQSIHNLPDGHIEKTDLLMVDEVHEFSNGEKSIKVINSFESAKIKLGFTATVPSDPIRRYTLIGSFGDVIETTSTSSLVSTGHLTKPIIQILNVSSTFDKGDEYLSYKEIYDKYIVNCEERNNVIKNIVEKICSRPSNPKILILVNSLDHGKILEKLIPKSVFIEGVTSLSDRYKTIDKFKNKSNCSVLIGSKIMQTGVSINEITHFINARGLKSEIATIQALGRSLRKHESKEVVYVYDFKDEHKYLNRHYKERLSSYKKEGHEIVFI